MLITINGMLIRMDVKDISKTGRSTQGVRLMRLSGDELISTVAKVEKEDDDEDILENLEEDSTLEEIETPSTEEQSE